MEEPVTTCLYWVMVSAASLAAARLGFVRQDIRLWRRCLIGAGLGAVIGLASPLLAWGTLSPARVLVIFVPLFIVVGALTGLAVSDMAARSQRRRAGN